MYEVSQDIPRRSSIFRGRVFRRCRLKTLPSVDLEGRGATDTGGSGPVGSSATGLLGRSFQ